MKPIRILLQTTIPFTEDDWHIGRFSQLKAHLDSLLDDNGARLCEVTARDREVDASGDDVVLSQLDSSDFDELWLFAVDSGDGLTKADCEGITRFRQRGGGILAMRDHNDLGSSLCTLGGIGEAHYFHSSHPDPDESRHVPDDPYNTTISWPNYHSGSNGDYQTISPTEPLHQLLRRSGTKEAIEFFPAHPHEGGIGVPDGVESARVIATGKSKATERPFNLIVGFDSSVDQHGNTLGRAVAESSFHHFVDYNLDVTSGCPTGLVEEPGDQIAREPEKLRDVKDYVRNLAVWLAGGKK
ncbi:MAG: hypothetical protein ABIZ95_16240 [Pyrinomonadaceae bacterium]